MKIIHTADVHLDSKLGAHFNHEKAGIRRAELLDTFVRMVDYAEENGCAAVLISGDLFDTEHVSFSASDIVKKTILRHPDIFFFYLKGNHDALGFFETGEDLPENLKTFSDTWRHYRIGNVDISGAEFTAENRSTLLQEFSCDMEQFNIVMLHGQEEIDFRALKNKGIDYLALGHIHEPKTEKLDARGIYVYPGCLEGRGFDESGERGFYLVEIDEETLSCQPKFVPFAKRTVYTVPVDVSDCHNTPEMKESIEKAVSERKIGSENLVRVVLKGRIDPDLTPDMDFLQVSFEERFFLFEAVNETKPLIEMKFDPSDHTLKGTFLSEVLSDGSLDEDEKAEIVKFGLLALEGKEILL